MNGEEEFYLVPKLTMRLWIDYFELELDKRVDRYRDIASKYDVCI